MFNEAKNILPRLSSIQNTEKHISRATAFRVFRREDSDSDEFNRVLEIARSLREHMDSTDVRSKLAAANALGRSSHEVQACFLGHAGGLGFETEKTGLFSNYKVANLRPDYYLRLSAGRGILLEVEREGLWTIIWTC
jgi:hypothetical protein